MDITQLILDDHHEQRRLFAILEQIDRADTGTLSRGVGTAGGRSSSCTPRRRRRSSTPRCCRWGSAARRGPGVEDETLDAIHDHNDIRDAVAAVARPSRSAATTGTRRSPRRTWPTATTWPRRNARA